MWMLLTLQPFVKLTFLPRDAMHRTDVGYGKKWLQAYKSFIIYETGQNSVQSFCCCLWDSAHCLCFSFSV